MKKLLITTGIILAGGVGAISGWAFSPNNPSPSHSDPTKIESYIKNFYHAKGKSKIRISQAITLTTPEAFGIENDLNPIKKQFKEKYNRNISFEIYDYSIDLKTKIRSEKLYVLENDKVIFEKIIQLDGFFVLNQELIARYYYYSNPEELDSQKFNAAILPIDYKISSKVRKIYDHAFLNARGNINIPDTVTSVGEGVFSGALLPKTWKNPKAWETRLPNYAYQGALFSEGFTLPLTIKTMGNNVFSGVKKNLPSIPDSVTSIGSNAFNNAIIPINWKPPKAWSVIIPDYAYQGALFPKNFTLPSTIKTIRDHAFSNIKENVPLIPDSVTFIGGGVFKNSVLSSNWKNPKAWSTSLPAWAYEAATIPEGFVLPLTVTSIGPNAFINSKIPLNCKWVDKNGNTITDLTHISGGSRVVKK